MSSLPRQRTGRPAAQGLQDELSPSESPQKNRRGRKRRELSASTMMLSFGLLPGLVLLYLVGKSLSRTPPHPWNPMEEGHMPAIVNRKANVEQPKDPVSPSDEVRTPHVRNMLTLTAYMEPPETLDSSKRPMPPRDTNESTLTRVEFPKVQQCSSVWETFPINEYPTSDPFLPWIHDYFPSEDGASIKFVAQNRRRCDTGDAREESMLFWEPQMALFQPVPVVEESEGRIRLASSVEEATVKETRFICRFHTVDKEYTTFSQFPFNYEYVSWRKGKDSMLQKTGKDNLQFWLSQLMFHCPVPGELQHVVARGEHVVRDTSQLWLDLIPIRTPARNGERIFTQDHVGTTLLKSIKLLDLQSEFGTQHFLPEIEHSGRWANLPICLPPLAPKHYKLTACTWTSASYTRRGDAVTLGDTEARLREWIIFQKLVGFDQVVIYDNTSPEVAESPLSHIAKEFPDDFVKYHRWPCTLCNNNRPNHPNPGERSSQYAAEASCRERYGPSTDWMAFIDTDEYLVPMASETWQPILEKFEEREIHILKMRSSRAKPRIELMDDLEDQSVCLDPVARKSKPKEAAEPCIGPRRNETFLHVYNCEFIRPPRPDRFERAMKQIYRPSYVFNHFVHYSTVTADIARLYKDFGPDEEYVQNTQRLSWKKKAPEIFLDDMTEGTLIHTRSVLPHETQYRSNECRSGSKYSCTVGHLCPDETEFSDEAHKKNGFTDGAGKYCNCWKNAKIEDIYVPLLARMVNDHMEMISEA